MRDKIITGDRELDAWITRERPEGRECACGNWLHSEDSCGLCRECQKDEHRDVLARVGT